MAISSKQKTAIPMILTAKTIGQGCRDAGINKSTYFRWMKGNEFAAEIKKQRKKIVDRAYDLLQQAHEKAAQALIELLDSEDERVRIRSAESILDRYVNYTQAEELETRIAAIEDKIAQLLDEKAKDGSKL